MLLRALWPYALIALLAAAACAPMLMYGAANGHSIEYNLVWLKNFSAQLAQGDIYPRWLMDMNSGAGSPVFYYYAPLPFYILSIPALIFSGSKLIVQLAIGEWLMIALSGMSFYYFAKHKFSTRMALLSACFYMLLPYHFEIDLWQRQDIGELSNYIWMPLALYFTERLIDGKNAIAGLALVYGLMMLTHLPSTLLFSIALGFYLLALAWRRHHWRFILHFAAAIALGLVLTGIYWVPALFSQQYIRTDQLWSAVFDFHRWFYPIHGEPLDAGEDDAFALRLFGMIALTSAMFVLCWLNAYRWRHVLGHNALFACLILMAIAWFLMSPYSQSVWETVPVLWKVQFPWRIAMVLDLATAIAMLHSLHCLEKYHDRIGLLVVASVTGLLLYSLASANVLHKLDPFDNAGWIISRDQSVRDGVDAPEYSTAWNPTDPENEDNSLLNIGPLHYDGARGKVSVAKWSPRSIALHINLQQATTLRIRQYYFPNWQAESSSGEPLALHADKTTGLLTLQAPAGQYTLHLHLGPMQQELIGGALSAGGVLILLGSAWRQRRSTFKARLTQG
ncbi:MAG: glycosyltransferase family 39 protein [Pseudomonadaceae bacterium]|nr:glycosyltransferase family 39 protein [Pseudomonadaceae bacterium]